MMNEQDKKQPAGWPRHSAQAAAATLKDDCFTLPKPGTAEWKSLDEYSKRFRERQQAGSIPKYGCLKTPGV